MKRKNKTKTTFNMSTFNLAKKRVTRGLTQEQLSYKSGVSSRQIQRIEAGVSTPKTETVQKLLKVLK